MINPLNILLGAAAVGGAALLWTHWPRHGAALAAQRYRQWRDGRIAEGATPEQLEIETAQRLAMARMRRLASEAVLTRPADYKQIIQEAIAHHAAGLESMHGKESAAVFAQACTALRDDEILYPDALAAAHAHDPVVAEMEMDMLRERRKKPEYDADFLAAYTDI